MGHARPLKNIYCIGDNVCTDIFGANLYNRYLSDSTRRRREVQRGGGGGGGTDDADAGAGTVLASRSIDHLLGSEASSEWIGGAENCYSVLVETGVYSSGGSRGGGPGAMSLDHSPRDFLPVEESYQEPTYVASNVLEAVDLIFKKEGFS